MGGAWLRLHPPEGDSQIKTGDLYSESSKACLSRHKLDKRSHWREATKTSSPPATFSARKSIKGFKRPLKRGSAAKSEGISARAVEYPNSKRGRLYKESSNSDQDK